MGLYNFQERFVDYVADGSKTHTIRAERKGHNDMPGNWMHLYTGLRHKGARLLRRARCVRVDFVRIDPDGRVYIGCSVGQDDYLGGASYGGLVKLDQAEKNLLAWRDGFRPTGSTADRPGEAFPLMMQFWEGRLPFTGQILHWSLENAVRWVPKDAVRPLLREMEAR